MKTSYRPDDTAPVKIYLLVDQLMKAYLPQAVKQSSFIINDVEPGLAIATHEQILAHILGNLLGQIVKATSNGCIRVFAEKSGQFLQIGLKDELTVNHEPFFAQNLPDVYKALKKLGGNIRIDDLAQKGTLIAITVPLNKRAA